jgi:hypothetical protein
MNASCNINAPTDATTVDAWTSVLQDLEAGIRVITRPVCYASIQQRTNTNNRLRLTPVASNLDIEHTHTGHQFGHLFRAAGTIRFIASPVNSITFEGSTAAYDAFLQQGLSQDTKEFNSLCKQHRQQWLDRGGYYGNCTASDVCEVSEGKMDASQTDRKLIFNSCLSIIRILMHPQSSQTPTGETASLKSMALLDPRLYHQ